MNQGFLELERARTARLESERIENEKAAAQTTSPNAEAVKARDLLERRDAAYLEAMNVSRRVARASAFEKRAKAQTAFDSVSLDPKATYSALFEAYRALRVAYEEYQVAIEVGNVAQEERRQMDVPQGIAALTFAQVLDHTTAWHVAAAGEASRTAINDAMNAAGAAAAAKIN
jgi:hypothetical protein